MTTVMPQSVRGGHGLTNRPRCTKFGLEVSGGLTYSGWEPGGEYTKALMLKNVQLKTQKIKYRISGNQFSSAAYPQHIVLSAGTSCTLPITFRPSVKNPCEECVEFETAEGQVFTVPIKAQLPRANFSLPDCLEFGLCAVKDSVVNNFEISNTGNVSAEFTWEAPDGFTISPQSGSLAPKQTCRLTATFTPLSASVYNATAACSFATTSPNKAGKTTSQTSTSHDQSGANVKSGSAEYADQKARTMKLKGCGKYPYVVVRPVSRKAKAGTTKRGGLKSEGQGGPDANAERVMGAKSGGEVVVDFGSVAIGGMAERLVEIANISPVSARFAVQPLPSQQTTIPASFTCGSPLSGTVQPHGSTRLQLVYSPAVVTPHPSLGGFSVTTQAGLGATTVKCVGRAKGPRVEVVGGSVLCFGNVQCGGRSSPALLHLTNRSDVDTHFQLQLGEHSVFQAEPSSGRLAGGASIKISVAFSPLSAVPHCRRVACLLHNQEPLFVYLMGTGYSETVRPFILQPSHAALTEGSAQLSTLPPQLVKQHLEEGRLRVGPGGCGLEPSPDHTLPGASRPAPPPSPYTGYLHSELDPFGVAHVSCDVDALQFDYCNTNSSQEKLVSVTNHTQGAVCCVWMAGDGFTVFPGEREVAAGCTAAFTVRFKPDKPSKFYCRELECFAFYKALGDYRGVDPLSVVGPPWCLSLTVSGHSFPANTQPLLPRVSFPSSGGSGGASVVFPPTTPGRPVHQTALLTNTGDTPALFQLSHDPTGVFTVKPSHGLLQPGHQILILEMVAMETRLYTHDLTCSLNASATNTQVLRLLGSGEAPSITLDNKGQLYFKPTCVGSTSTAQLAVTNTSRLPARFEWRLGDVGSAAVSVDPVAGTILPNETQHHCWQFSPVEARQYTLKAVLHTSPCHPLTTLPPHHPHQGHGAHSLKHREVLSVFGLATSGLMQCSPSFVECGTVVIGSTHPHTLTLSNPSLCDLHYQLSVQHNTDTSSSSSGDRGGGGGDKVECVGSVVELSPQEGVLAARSQIQLRVSVRALSRAPHTSAITYHLVPGPGSQQAGGEGGGRLCTLAVRGAYPAVSVADVQGLGATNMLSKASLWSMLSIDQVNCYLTQEPHSSELRYAIATRHSMRRRVPVRTTAVVGFDFGAATLGSVGGGGSEVRLVLENRGEVPAEWAFQFPVDMHLEPEYWAESGRLEEAERHELNVLTNQLFSASPKSGRLEPGQNTRVLCSYRHTHIGTNRLPVLLKINRGREILLNWCGVTVEPGRPYIHFTSLHHCFQPVPIGAHAPPRQYYELLNAGDSAVSYELDTSPLEALCQANYLMPILECLQPRGEVPAGQSTAVPFVFSPLEAKTYTVNLPVHFSNGDSVILTFSGEGYTPHSADQPTLLQSLSTTTTAPALQAGNTTSVAARLSQESLALGALPLFAVKRSLVFVSNASSHTLSFEWEMGSGRASEVIAVQPVRGYIQPGQSAACKVTFRSHSAPSCYNLDLLCKVQDESELLRYHDDLQEWRQREEERQHTFTITQAPPTDTSCNTTGKASSKRPQSMPKLKSVAPIGGKSRPLSSDSQLRAKYTPLPPIASSTQEQQTYEEWKTKDLSTKSKSRPRVRKDTERKVPIPPEPVILHLGVTAKTHSIPDYASLYDDLYSFHIDPQAPATLHQASPPSSGRVKALTREKELLESILNQMIRELLEDSNFQSAVQRVVNEPVPYFSQFAAEQSVSKTGSSQKHSCTSELVEPHQINASTPLPPSPPSLPHPSPPSHDPAALHTDNEANGQQTSFADDSLGLIHEEPPIALAEDLDTAIKHLPEFEGLVEGVLENTLLNVLKEATAGELSFTAPLYTVAKPLLTETAS